MLKVSEWVEGAWHDRNSPAVFREEHVSACVTRLRVAIAHEEALLLKLLDCLRPPLQLLYVLHTTRGEGDPGRYESAELPRSEVRSFLTRFQAYLAADARYDLWVRSASSGDLIVWDRHDDLFVYGNLGSIAARLRQLGYRDGAPPALGTHRHNYRCEFDREAAEVLRAFPWRRTPLRPEDEQSVAPGPG